MISAELAVPSGSIRVGRRNQRHLFHSLLDFPPDVGLKPRSGRPEKLGELGRKSGSGKQIHVKHCT
jgi:hypothetical protein